MEGLLAERFAAVSVPRVGACGVIVRFGQNDHQPRPARSTARVF
jgi:hypothetical protein